MIAERAFLGDWLKRHKLFGRFYTISVVLIGWVLFRANGLSGAFVGEKESGEGL